MQSVFDAHQKNRPQVSHLVSFIIPNSLLYMTVNIWDMQIPGHIRGLVSREGYIRLSADSLFF